MAAALALDFVHLCGMFMSVIMKGLSIVARFDNPVADTARQEEQGVRNAPEWR